MNTCGNCRHWSGRLSTAYMGLCIFDAMGTPEWTPSKLGDPKLTIAFDSPACENWARDTERDMLTVVDCDDVPMKYGICDGGNCVNCKCWSECRGDALLTYEMFQLLRLAVKATGET